MFITFRHHISIAKILYFSEGLRSVFAVLLQQALACRFSLYSTFGVPYNVCILDAGIFSTFELLTEDLAHRKLHHDRVALLLDTVEASWGGSLKVDESGR